MIETKAKHADPCKTTVLLGFDEGETLQALRADVGFACVPSNGYLPRIQEKWVATNIFNNEAQTSRAPKTCCIEAHDDAREETVGVTPLACQIVAAARGT